MFLALFLSRFLLINTGAAEAQSIGVLNLILFAGVHAFDQLAGGLGTAVLMTFLMRLCMKEFKAAHYAIGTGLMSVSGVFVGGISFLFSIPGMIAVFFLPDYIFTKKSS